MGQTCCLYTAFLHSPMAVGRSLGPASLCPGRSRALGRGRGGGDETSEMADHQPYSLYMQREGEG